MNLKRRCRVSGSLNLVILFLIFGKNVEGYANDKLSKRSIDAATLERVFTIADRIGRYSETVPNLFRVVKKNLVELEREVKLNAMLPSRNKLDAFRVISEPFNRFLREGPKEYYIHNPPRGTAYNVQLNNAKDLVRDVYRELQTLWLSER